MPIAEIIEYEKEDILEHVREERRVRLLDFKGDRYKVESLASGQKRWLSSERLREDYANLTAQQDGRYRR